MHPDRPTVCVLVDAFRHDYLDPALAPRLAALAREGAPARLRPILGYSDAIRATVFTGAYPDEHGYWMEYCYRPSSAPMRRLAGLRGLDRLPVDLARRSVKWGLSQTTVRRIAARDGYAHLSMRHFPFRSLSEFDWTLRESMSADGALGMPTLFDRLTGAGVPWRYLDAARDGTRGMLRALDSLAPDTRFTFVYLHHIDMASHMLGVENALFRRAVRYTDTLTGEVVDRLRARLGDVNLVVFSDHGMSQVRRTVSYPDLWTHPSFPSRFCFALDATMVRLWFHDEDELLRAQVRARVAAGAPGRWVSRRELADLHLAFDNRLYGDEVFLLEPGVAIFPNFHSMLNPRAMHAYHPDDPDQQGIFIAPADERVDGTVELVDVHDLCARLSGLAPADVAPRRAA
jgi:Type I phosphodiesterase / nucleotide pyrophosphatase